MPQFTGLQNSDFPLLLLQTLPAFLTTCRHARQVSPTPQGLPARPRPLHLRIPLARCKPWDTHFTDGETEAPRGPGPG